MSVRDDFFGSDASSGISLIRTGALTLSFLVHGLLFVSFGGAISASTPEVTTSSVTRLSFLPQEPVPQAPPELPEEVVENQPENDAEPKKVEEAPPNRVEEVKKVATPEKIKPVKAQSQPRQLAAASVDSQPQVAEGLIRWERERYLSDVMAHIEEHKWYPGIARRKGIEGDVRVRFVLQSDGSVQNILIEHGPQPLMAAARKTIERAMPMPRPPENVDCPVECQFLMRFSLSGS